jgi:hypothetical protein
VLLWAVEVGEVADLYGVAGGQGYVKIESTFEEVVDVLNPIEVLARAVF